MKQFAVIFVAAYIAGLMAWMLRSGARPSLRAAVRTTAIMVVGWTVTASNAEFSFRALPWRIWIMLALSFFAVGAAWWFYWQKPLIETTPATADRLNLPIAICLALLLLTGPTSESRTWQALLLVSGAFILARRHSR